MWLERLNKLRLYDGESAKVVRPYLGELALSRQQFWRKRTKYGAKSLTLCVLACEAFEAVLASNKHSFLRVHLAQA
jgi:hypothetical protein